MENRAQGGAPGAVALPGLAPQLRPPLQVKTQPPRGRRHRIPGAAANRAADALQARGDVGGHQGAFHQQRAAAAHGIKQCPAFGIAFGPLPAQQHAGGQVLLERRLALGAAPSPAMQGAAAQVHRQQRPALAHHQVQAHIRRIQVHVGPLAAVLAQGIHHRVLGALGGIAGVGDGAAGHVRIHRQGQACMQVVGPVQGAGAGIEGLFVRAVPAGDWPKHAAGGA